MIVITGASSGIGLVTAGPAAEEGAKAVPAARGREAIAVPCEVADRAQVARRHHDEPPRDPDGALHRPSQEAGWPARPTGPGGARARVSRGGPAQIAGLGAPPT